MLSPPIRLRWPIPGIALAAVVLVVSGAAVATQLPPDVGWT